MTRAHDDCTAARRPARVSLPSASFTVGAIVLACLLATPPEARACKCPAGPDFVLPRDGATKVPVNTRVVVSSLYTLIRRVGSSPTLVVVESGEGGERVAARLDTLPGLPGRKIFILTPASALLPHEKYELVAILPDGTRRSLSSFSTGMARDTKPPKFEGLTSFMAKAGPKRDHKTCTVRTDGYSEVKLSAGKASDETAPTEDLMYVLYLWPKGETPVPRLAGPLSYGPIPTAAGDTLCSPIRPYLKTSDKVCARAEVFDLAGNTAGGTRTICGGVKLLRK